MNGEYIKKMDPEEFYERALPYMKELPSEEEEIPFRIKTYKKKELACMYNPNITPRCAIRIFTKWIKINKELLRLLTATGYHPRTRTFTPRQVQIITSILDIP